MRTDETPEFIMAVNRLENKIDAISLMNDPNNQPTSSLQRTNNDYTTSGTRQPPRSTNTSSYQYERNRTPPPDPRTSGYDQQAYQPRTSNFRRDERFRDSTYDEQFRGGGQRAPPRGIMRQPTNYVNNQRRTVSFNTSDFQPCDRCGQTGHNAGTCRFKNAFCFYCAKQGILNEHVAQLDYVTRPVRIKLLAKGDLNRQLENNQVGATIHLDTNCIYIKVNNVSLKTLCDTGSSRNCMNVQTTQRLKLKIQPLDGNDCDCLFGANGDPIEILGTVSVDVNINGLKMPTTFQILKNLSHSIILGIEFLEQNKAVIDTHRGIVTFHDITGTPFIRRRPDNTAFCPCSPVYYDPTFDRSNRWRHNR